MGFRTRALSSLISKHLRSGEKGVSRFHVWSGSRGLLGVSRCLCANSGSGTGRNRNLDQSLLFASFSRAFDGENRFFQTSSHYSAAAIEVEGPAFAESITEGDIRWLKQVGDFVKEDELVAEIETDKTSVEVPAPQSGIIASLLVGDGEKVVAKQKLYTLTPSEAPAGGSATPPAPPTPAPKPAEPEPVAAAPPPAPKPKSDSAGPIPKVPPPVPPVPAQPMTSKPVGHIQLTPAPPPPAPAPPAPAPPPPPPAPRATAVGEQAITGARSETRVKMNRMRQRIAQRLKDAQNTYAMLTTFNEIDMGNIMDLRSKYKEVFLKKHGVKLSFMSPFVKAAAYALENQPVCNAVIDEGEIVYRHFIDVSIAVATPRGLVVPVLRGVESMNYAQIEAEINELGAKARDNKLAIEDMEGGTFTISNGGVFGSMMGTPIINPPQSAILGMHNIVDRPMAVNGKVEIRPMMTVALTYDHRLIDGREAVTFLRKIKQAVEDPRTILLDL